MNKRFEKIDNKNDPIEKIIFTDPDKEKEWEALSEEKKEFVRKNISACASKMKDSIAIEMLCHVINELLIRVEKLEKE